MASVSLGRERDPSGTGTEGLLRMAVGGDPGFKMVEFDFYREQLENFKVILQRNAGSMSWVIGGRGTGKSEVLSHLFRESIVESPKNPRLPLYISITDKEERERYQDKRVQSGKGRDEGLDDGSVTMGLFNYLCSQSLLEALAYLHSTDEDDVDEGGLGRFSLLRKCISNQKFYESLTDGDNGELNSADFSLLNFMKTIRDHEAASKAFRLAIICDDFDKLSPDVVQPFFSNAQNDFQTLSGTHKVVIVSSVTKEFVSAAKGNPEMNYCMSQTPAERKVELGELWVPDISELTSGEIQEFIDHRIRHLHWDGVEWGFDADIEPHDTVQDVIGSEGWDSYDPTRMRVNGALLELNSWLSRRDEVSMRQIITCLDTVLKKSDSPKVELTPVLLESALNQNNREEKGWILKELGKRMEKADVTIDSLRQGQEWLELAAEEERLGDDARWEALCTVVLDKVALGKWRKTPLAIMKGKKPGLMAVTANYSEKSGIFQFIKLVSELAEDEGLLKKVLSRTPDELFKKISSRDLALKFKEMLGKAQDAEKSAAEETTSDHIGDSIATTVTRSNEVKQPKGIVTSAYDDALEDCDLEWGEVGDWDSLVKTQFGHSMAYRVVRWMIGVGDWKDEKSMVKSSYDGDVRGFVNTLMQWFSMLLSTEDSEESDLLLALHKVFRGNDSRALANLAGRRGSDPFDELQHRKKFVGARDFVDDFYSDAITGRAPSAFDVEVDIHPPTWRGLATVMKGLKIDSTQSVVVGARHRPESGDGLEDDMVQLTVWLDELNSELGDGKLVGRVDEGKSTDLSQAALINTMQGEYLQMIPHFVKLEVDVTFETDRAKAWLALCGARDSGGNAIPWVDIKSTNWDKKGFMIKGDISRSHHEDFKSLDFFFKELDASQSREGTQAPYRMVIGNRGKRSGNWMRVYDSGEDDDD